MGEFEVLRLIAELSMLFMSITIPTFAIAVSYLGRETARSMKFLKSKRNEVERKLDEKMKSLGPRKTRLEEIEKDIEEMKKDIEKYRLEEQQFKDRINALSAKGTVLYPSFFFGLALLISAFGIYHYPEILVAPSGAVVDYWQLILCAVGSIFFGAIFLARSLKAIERASLEVVEKEEEGVYVVDWSSPTGALTGDRVIVVGNRAYHMGEPFDSWARQKGLSIVPGFGGNHITYLKSRGIKCTCRNPPSIEWLEHQTA